MTTPLSQDLRTLILTTNLDEKLSLGFALKNFAAVAITPLSPTECVSFKSPGRPENFSVVSPRAVPKRNFQDPQARIHFLHAIANIELLAIELPALCLLRFGANDLAYIQRQLDIIAEEALHFSLLQKRLQAMDTDFGTLPCHNGLWDYAWQCANALEHQIVIPCYLEARGLDVTPGFIEKFKAIGDDESAAVMQTILTDEIQHVLTGQEYLQKQAARLQITADELFEQTLNRFFDGKIKSKVPLNHANRIQAGFSEEMMATIS